MNERSNLISVVDYTLIITVFGAFVSMFNDLAQNLL